MKVAAWHLPWKTSEDVPHALLDIIRGCNIRCSACYNSAPNRIKSMAEIECEIESLLSFRRLQSVSIVGGEVTLHPELCAIVRSLKSRGLGVTIFTNAVLLDAPLLADLAEAGTDLIFLHIDSGQLRPDLQQCASPDELRDLINAKAALVAAHGIEVGLAMTAYEGQLEEVADFTQTVLESSCLHYLIVTLHRDLGNITNIQGDLFSGMQGKFEDPLRQSRDVLTNLEMMQLMKAKFGFVPFAFIGSNVDRSDSRWVSYLIATTHRQGRLRSRLNVRASMFERIYLFLSHLFTGRYPMYQRQSPALFRIQLLLNALTGGRCLKNILFLLRSGGSGARLSAKKILFQCPAFMRDDGIVVHCFNCPDAVVKNGTLVPVCISDKVTTD